MKLGVGQLDLRGKRVFLRADFNVPVVDGTIADDTRIRAVMPTIECCLTGGASVILASHLGRPKGRDPRYSLTPVAFRLEGLLGRPVALAPDCVGPVCERVARALRPGQLLLLENLRFHQEEEANDPGFARALAAPADCYVNDAFSVCNRAHASVVAITRFLQPAAAGLLLQRELEALRRILDHPNRPLVLILGGAKVLDKLALIRNLVPKVDRVLIGGAMAFTFLKALGGEIGRSPVEVLARPTLGAPASLRARHAEAGTRHQVVREAVRLQAIPQALRPEGTTSKVAVISKAGASSRSSPSGGVRRIPTGPIPSTSTLRRRSSSSHRSTSSKNHRGTGTTVRAPARTIRVFRPAPNRGC
jgi:phosphoglycerate kinase